MSETSFIWEIDEEKDHGANINPITKTIKWYNDATLCTCGAYVVCGCVKSTYVQSFEQFRQDGPALVSLPADILAKMQEVAK
jgi:hypothetical protein